MPDVFVGVLSIVYGGEKKQELLVWSVSLLIRVKEG